MAHDDRTDERPRWVGVGHSALDDAARAGAEAARAAMTGPEPRLVVVLAAIAYDLDALVRGVRSVTGDTPLVGCSTHGEIWAGGPSDGTVLVMVLGGAGFSATVASVQDVAGRQREAGAELARALRDTGAPMHPHAVLMLFTDPLVPDQEAVLRGIYEVFGASVPLCGGAAADRWTVGRAFQLCDDQVLSGAVSAVLLRSDAPLSVALGHGWQPVGEPMVVTRCDDGRVHTLDDEPALDAYLRRVDAPVEAYTDVAAFTDFALTRPVGIGRLTGAEVRNLATEPDLEGRTIAVGHAPPGGLTWIMAGDEASILGAVSTTCEAALAPLDGRPPLALLTFSCSALRTVLGTAGTRREAELIGDVCGGAPFAGFYTGGEIARTRGIDGFHHQTLVVLAIS